MSSRTVTGDVTRVSSQFAEIRVDRGAACTACSEGRGCGVLLLSRQRDAVIRVPLNSTSKPDVGQSVALVCDTKIKPAVLALLGYGLPLAGMLFALLALPNATDNDAVAVSCGLAGLVAGWGLAKVCVLRVLGDASMRIDPAP